MGIRWLLEQGARIDGCSVGTKFGVSAAAPWADCVYKLVEYDGRPVLKLSTGKATLPGLKQVFRSKDQNGQMIEDDVGMRDQPVPSGFEPLLNEVMLRGKKTERVQTLSEARERFLTEFGELPEKHKSLENTAP